MLLDAGEVGSPCSDLFVGQVLRLREIAVAAAVSRGEINQGPTVLGAGARSMRGEECVNGLVPGHWYSEAGRSCWGRAVVLIDIQVFDGATQPIQSRSSRHKMASLRLASALKEPLHDGTNPVRASLGGLEW